MQSNSQPKEINNLLFPPLPKDIQNLIWAHLSKSDQDALSQCSKNRYRLIRNIELSQLPAMYYNDQLMVLVKLALHIDSVGDDIDFVIYSLRQLAAATYPYPGVAAIALTCLAKLTVLTPAERIQRILALNSINAVSARCLSYMLVPEFNNLTLNIANEPSKLFELQSLPMPEILLCYSLLGITIDIQGTTNAIEAFYTRAYALPSWFSPLLLTPLMQKQSLLKPNSLTSDITLQALPLVIRERIKKDGGDQIRLAFKNLIRNIHSSDAEGAWEIIHSHIRDLSDTQTLHRVITESLPLFRQSEKMHCKLYAIIRIQLRNANQCSTYGCSCVLNWLKPLMMNAPHVSLDIPNLVPILMNIYDSHALWSELIRGVHTAELAASIIQKILGVIRSMSVVAYYPTLHVGILIELLDQNLAAQILDKILLQVSSNEVQKNIYEIICQLAKKIDLKTATMTIIQLLEIANRIDLVDNALFTETILTLAKKIDAQGGAIILPLLLKIINPKHDFNYPANQVLNYGLIVDFIYTKLAIANKHNFKREHLSKLYIDLNFQQIIYIWSYLIKHFGMEMKHDSLYSSLMIALAHLFPSEHLANVDKFLTFAIENRNHYNINIIDLLNNIRITNSLSEIKVIAILKTIIRTISLENNKFKLVIIIIPLIRQYQSIEFKNNILDILLRILASRDERVYERLLKLHNEDDDESTLFSNTIINNLGESFFNHLLSAFSLLTKADSFNMLTPLLKAWISLKSTATIRELFAYIHLLNSDNILTVHNKIISIIHHYHLKNKVRKLIIYIFPQYLAAINETQQLELFNRIYSMSGFTGFHHKLLVIFIKNCKNNPDADYFALIAKRTDLQIALGHYLPSESYTKLLPPPSSFESFFPNYLDLSDLSKSTDIISSLNSIVTCIKKINSIQNIPESTKAKYAFSLINSIRKKEGSAGDLQLIQTLALMQLTVEYNCPELAFIFPQPQHANVLFRFKALLASIPKSIYGMYFFGLAELNHPYAALVLISSLPTLNDIDECKKQAYEYIKWYCHYVTHVDRLDELTQALLNARNNFLAHIFQRNSTYSARGDSLYANRLKQFGLFENESCSHTAVKIFEIIETKKNELLASTRQISHPLQ